MIVGISITKRMLFRGVPEEFSNVYHYRTDTGLDGEDVIDRLVGIERSKIFGSRTTFTRARLWGPTDQGKQASEMLQDIALSGTGTSAFGGIATSEMYPELAVLISFNTGRKDTRGNPIFLRKYFHTAVIQGTLQVANALNPMAANAIDYWKGVGNEYKNLFDINPGAGASITNELGQELPVLSDPIVFPFPVIRQFRG